MVIPLTQRQPVDCGQHYYHIMYIAVAWETPLVSHGGISKARVLPMKEYNVYTMVEQWTTVGILVGASCDHVNASRSHLLYRDWVEQAGCVSGTHLWVSQTKPNKVCYSEQPRNDPPPSSLSPTPNLPAARPPSDGCWLYHSGLNYFCDERSPCLSINIWIFLFKCVVICLQVHMVLIMRITR